MDKPDCDQSFETLSSALAAFEFLARADMKSAVGCWNRSFNEAKLPDREAVVVQFANMGVAALLCGDRPSARLNIVRAATSLDGCDRAAESGDLRATSSGFHFRLAALHAGAFEQAHAARGAILRQLMSAVLAHHDALLDGRAGDRDKHRILATTIEREFGSSSVEARLCRAETVADISTCYAERAAKLRTILRHWPARARLTPEVAVAALAIWPSELLVEDAI